MYPILCRTKWLRFIKLLFKWLFWCYLLFANSTLWTYQLLLSKIPSRQEVTTMADKISVLKKNLHPTVYQIVQLSTNHWHRLPFISKLRSFSYKITSFFNTYFTSFCIGQWMNVGHMAYIKLLYVMSLKCTSFLNLLFLFAEFEKLILNKSLHVWNGKFTLSQCLEFPYAGY